MKKLLASWNCIVFCTFILFGCYKPDLPYQKNVPHCQIIKLRGEILFSDSIIITYNNKGNPVSMTRTHVGTGAPHYIFRYDKKDRLTDIIGAYSNDLQFETWHHYVYNDNSYNHKDLPVTDSFYALGTIGTGPLPVNAFTTRYADFTFDNYGRMTGVKDVWPYPYPNTSQQYYHYNNAGNLALITTVNAQGSLDSTYITSYDNKINMHQTNPIWQLVDRDYSVNNAFPIVSYNSLGLPTIIDGRYNSGNFLDFDFTGELEIFYDCSQPVVK